MPDTAKLNPIVLPAQPLPPPTPAAGATAAEWQNYLTWHSMAQQRAELVQLSDWRVSDIELRAAALVAQEANTAAMQAAAEAHSRLIGALGAPDPAPTPTPQPQACGVDPTPEQLAEMQRERARHQRDDKVSRLLNTALPLFVAALERDVTPDAAMIVGQAKGLIRAADDEVPPVA